MAVKSADQAVQQAERHNQEVERTKQHNGAIRAQIESKIQNAGEIGEKGSCGECGQLLPEAKRLEAVQKLNAEIERLAQKQKPQAEPVDTEPLRAAALLARQQHEEAVRRQSAEPKRLEGLVREAQANLSRIDTGHPDDWGGAEGNVRAVTARNERVERSL
jgi:superfamily II RNA helicase